MNIWNLRSGWDSLSELRRQMDRLFDITLDPSRLFGQSWRQFPLYNLYEMPTEYLLVAPLPGLGVEDLEISVVGNALTIKGERKRPASVPDEAYRRQERWLGRWSRTLTAPEKADLSKVTATLKNGLLLLQIAKLPEAQPRQVPIRVGEGQGNRTVVATKETKS